VRQSAGPARVGQHSDGVREKDNKVKQQSNGGMCEKAWSRGECSGQNVANAKEADTTNGGEREGD
jgi:hypothetical protein